MTRTFPALGPVLVVSDAYVPTAIMLDDGPRPYGVRYRSTVFVGPETYVAIAAGSLDLVVFCLDCDPEPGSESVCACDLLSCAECVSRSPFHHADPDKCICSTGYPRCPALGFGFCACLCHARVVKEIRQGGQKDDRERGVEVTGGALRQIEFSHPGEKP